METVKFTNEYGDKVDESQKDILEYFYKVYLVDEKPIKKEIYKYGNFIGNIYYVLSLEEIETRLKTEPSASINYSYNKNRYLVTEIRGYDNNSLTSCMTSVKNDNNESICFAKQEMHEGKLRLVVLEKHYYENNKLKYDFDYDQDGSCFLIYNMQDFQADIWPNSSEENFNWNGLEYYQFEQPIIPEK